MARAPTVQEATAWIIERFGSVSSQKVARGYLNSVLRSLDLVELEGDQIKLTAEGAAYLENPSASELLAIARRNVAGFDELLDGLAQGPMTTAELLTLLRGRLGVTWETDAQVGYRLGWLENMGQVAEDHGKWALLQVMSQRE